jgi:hypothetical protein
MQNLGQQGGGVPWPILYESFQKGRDMRLVDYGCMTLPRRAETFTAGNSPLDLLSDFHGVASDDDFAGEGDERGDPLRPESNRSNGPHLR